MENRVVLFDMDGTVLDTVTDLAAAVNHTLMRRGYPMRTVQQVKDATGNGAVELIARSLPQGHDTPQFDEIVAEYKAYYAAHTCEITAPYEGMPELLRELQNAGVKVAIVSNKPDPAVKILAQHFFPGIPAFGEMPSIPRKPAPDMIFRAVKELGGELPDTVYIGDSEVDVQTAHAAGVDVIAVSWGFRGRERLAASGAGRIADTVEELETLLK